MTRLATEVVESSPEPRPRGIAAWAKSPQAITIYCYVIGAFYLTIRLWVDPANRRQDGDAPDVNQATWFVRYAANAVHNFHLPALITTTMNAPHGVNLMWNTSFLLPGVVVSPITLLFGPQTALSALLVIGFAGSAASMFYVLRHWHASILAAALGGALYGFSPALINSGIGHYSLVLAMLPPLIIDRLLRLVTRDGRAWRNGIWLGLFVAGQVFIAEETLVDTIIAAVIFLIVLAISRPRSIAAAIPPALIGLGTAAVVALVLCGRALWVQFHGIAAHGAAATVTILYNGHFTNLGTLPYAFITPGDAQLLHTSGTAYIVNHYTQPSPEYLAYLGIPLIILLLAAIVYFWRNVAIRAAGLTCILLEWLGMGSRPIMPGVHSLPGFLLPWHFFEHLPVIGGMVPDRLCILADAAAAVVLAFALDLARSGVKPFVNWQNGAKIAAGAAVVALLPLFPTPYGVTGTNPLPYGWRATYADLHLTDTSRVMLVPYPWAATSQVLRWQAETGVPGTIVGGDFITPGAKGRKSRAGRTGETKTSEYIDWLATGRNPVPKPSIAQVQADMAAKDPAAVMAVMTPGTKLWAYVISLFGPPTVHVGQVYGWRLTPAETFPVQH
ncbi:MAG: hypothetical protein ACLQFR_10415 [Streptosporangiaceae bacterium]